MASIVASAGRCLIRLVNRYSTLQDLARAGLERLTYENFKAHFLENGDHHSIGRRTRQVLVTRFERIDEAIPIASTRAEGLLLAEMILNLDPPGALVECGCFAGGSSAKLSIVAKLLGRELFVFDSFEGLPVGQTRDQHCRWGMVEWSPGAYTAGGQAVVAQTIERFGELSACCLIKGWFSDSLRQLPSEIALAFVDVDLATSARTCMEAVWPRLATRGVFATHDTAFIEVLQTLYDPELWRERFQQIPPLLYGAGYGVCDAAPHLGYMVKGDAISSAYLKSLTLRKQYV